jgi:WD40 repeat protein
VSAVAFAPDGHTLATGVSDGSAVLWDLSGLEWLRGHAIEHSCDITGGGLTHDKRGHYVWGLEYVDVCGT